MTYDPKEFDSPVWQHIQEAQEEARRYEEMHNSPSMRTLRDLTTVSVRLTPAIQALEAFKATRPDVFGVGAASLDPLRLHAAPLAPSLVLGELYGLSALRQVTAQLTSYRLLNETSQGILRAAGVLGSITKAFRSPTGDAAFAVGLAVERNGVLAATASMINRRLAEIGPDSLTAATLAIGAIAENIARDERIRASLTSQWTAFGTLAVTANRLLEVPGAAARMQGLPGYLGMAATIEPYAAARSLFLFTPEVVRGEETLILDLMAEEILDDTLGEFEARLASVDQNLVGSVRGAWQSARSEIDDRVRHASSSLRHVMQALIVAFASKAQAEAWVRAQGLGKKRVVPEAASGARSAKKWAPQLRYIFRIADQDLGGEMSLWTVAEADLADMLLLLERFNKAVHQGAAEIPELDLVQLVRRATAFMTLLLDAYEMGAD